jgi:hypothetical protein
MSVNYISGDSRSVERDITYSVVPRAVKDYTGDVITTLEADVGLSDLQWTVADGSGLAVNTYYAIGKEEIYVKKIDGNKIVVERAKDNTTQSSHLRGDSLKGITAADDALIEMGDDFGFSGTIT